MSKQMRNTNLLLLLSLRCAGGPGLLLALALLQEGLRNQNLALSGYGAVNAKLKPPVSIVCPRT